MNSRELHKQTTLAIADYSVKVTSLTDSRYPDLERFRQNADGNGYDLYFRPYEAYQQKAKVYRWIFFGLSLFFLMLTSLTLFQKTSWFYTLYLQNHFFAKSTLCAFCFSLSLIAGYMGIQIRSEKEAVQHLFQRAAKKIGLVFARKRARFGLKHFLFLFDDYQESTALKQNYHESMDRLYEIREAAFSLFEQITKEEDLSNEERSRLFNQAILELRDRFNQVIHGFYSLSITKSLENKQESEGFPIGSKTS